MKEEVISLDKFKPREYQIPLINALEKDGYRRIIAVMPRRCLSGDTHITMHDGSFKLLRDIEVGDKILSFDGSTFVPDIVKNKWSTGIKKTVKVNTRGNLPLVSSLDHVFATINEHNAPITWKPLNDICTRRRLLSYAGNYSDTKSETKDLNMAEFWGYLLSDGYVAGDNQPKFTNINKEILDRVDYLASNLFNVKVKRREHGKGYDLGFSNGTNGGGKTPNPIKQLFRKENVNVPKYMQRLPKCVWSFNEDAIYRFIAAVISGDGSIYLGPGNNNLDKAMPPTVEISISCGKSYDYAFDIYWLLRKIGITMQLPINERGSNWKIKISTAESVQKLLSVPIIGKGYVQNKALDAIKTFTKVRKTTSGCYLSSFTYSDHIDQELFDIETEVNHNFIANGLVVHNSGKDITAFNIAIRQCLKKVGTVFYVFPTFSQGRRIIWDAIQNDGMRILDYIPKQLVESRNEQQMRIRFVNGSVLQIIGSDNYDNTLVGTNPMGVIFSEFALTDPRAYQFVRPILTANGGWCFIQSTPRGRNSFWELFKIAQDNPQSWFHYIKTVDETKHISIDDIQKEIASGEISEDLAMQEYWCSFDMGVEGSYYAKYIDKMRLEGRIDYVAWEPGFQVHTAWDIGVRDSTSIVFFQSIGTSIRIIDYYEKSKEGLEHYVKIVKDKPYLYGKHIAPHDIAVKEFGSGMTRLEKAMNLGIDFTISNRLSIEDGIEAVRSNLPKIFIDKVKCDRVIKALENYRQEFDSKKKVYKQTPLHNEWSHCCDAIRYMCVSLPKVKDGMTKDDVARLRNEAIHGSQSNIPDFFRTNNSFPLNNSFP